MSETRTPEYYDFLRSQGYSEPEIAKTRSRLNHSQLANDTSAYFVHEATNALGFIHGSTDEDGRVLVAYTPEDYAQSRQRLLNVRRGLGWFTQAGPIPKNVIEAFITKAESVGDWNQQLVQQLFAEFIQIETASYS
jgi:hypothetical protein